MDPLVCDMSDPGGRTPHLRHLGAYSDLVAAAEAAAETAAAERARPPLDPATVRRLIGFDVDPGPADPRVDGRWSADGVDGEEVSWSVGYGPRTRAWLLRPAGSTGSTGSTGQLPGVVALHSHDGLQGARRGPRTRP